MKKISLLTIAVLAFVVVAGQNVGIGTNAPQAPFHIRSMTASEVLRAEGVRPFISLYDVNDGYRGFLWYDGATVSLGTAFASGLPVIISPNLTFNTTFMPNGFVGIGNPSPLHKLDVSGDINFTGSLNINGSAGSPGMVLTSQGNLASPIWMPAPATGNSAAFSAVVASHQLITNAVWTDIGFYSEAFEEGGDNFNPLTGVFIVPETGLYHFDIIAKWEPPVTNSVSLLQLNINGFSCYGCQTTFHMQPHPSYDYSVSLSATQKLFAGDQVRIRVYQNSPDPLRLVGGLTSGATSFSGYRIR